VGRGLGRLAWIAGRRDRRRALDHLALAFPELPGPDRRRLARDNFLHQGMNLAELLHLWRRDPAEILPHVEVAGWEELEAARSSGRLVLILTGHCGNWELLSPVLAARGIPLAAVARPVEDPEVQEMMVGLRRHLGTTTIPRGSRGASRQLLETLRRGGLLAMLIDQDTQKVDGVWVPFFGRPAWTPVAAAELALRHKAQVIPFFIERRADGDHLLRFHPALDLPEDPVEATARMTAKIEEQVRRRPEQWVWQHRRWRRRPPAGA
jgi:KDO2-lipid IV(A) lauroyltransferase